jgi:hypothetical protein
MSRTMERLFSPCNRLPDILKTCPPVLHELTLADGSAEELLWSAEKAFTYDDLYAGVLGSAEDSNTVVWLTPHAVVARDGESIVCYWIQLDTPCRFSFNVDDGKAMIALARSPEHLSEICNVVLRLLAAAGSSSVVRSVILNNFESLDDVMIHAPTLGHLMEQCPSLKSLTMRHLEMDESHCRVLGAYSRPNLDIVLNSCKLGSAGTSALAEILRNNQGPTTLAYCHIDYSVVADALRGNRRLKSLKPFIFSSGGVSNEEFLAIAGALKGNKGLVNVDLSYNFRMKDETWDILCDSLKTHPTLQVLKLLPIQQFRGRPLAPAVLMSRMQALVNMLKVNMSIHTIHLHDRYSEHELYRESIIPYLEKNRVRAIQRTSPMTYRAKVLGRALLSARADANRFWILLSGNAEIAFPSSNTMTTLMAANLSAPADLGASANPATGAAYTVATDGVPATNAAAVLASSKKRKACPQNGD